MKVKLNPMFEQVSGQLGDLVFRELRGETIASRKPAGNAEPTVDQVAHRERFKQAVAYGRFVMANQTARDFYESIAEEKDIPVFALTIADFFNAPSINSVDLSTYNGQIADKIMIVTSDDFGVVNVHVAITDNNGAAIESGNAMEYPVGTGHWNYTATVAVPAGTNVDIKVTATDRPGGTAVQTVNKTL